MDNNTPTLTMKGVTHTQQHYVFVSSPGIGHLIPILELAKRISNLHNIKSTILLVSTRSSSNSKEESNLFTSEYLHNNPLLDLIIIPAVDVSDKITPDADIVWKVAVLMRETIPAIKVAIERLVKPTTIILDMFATESLTIVKDLGLPVYFYCTSSAFFMAVTAAVTWLDVEVKGEYVDQPERLKIPGCKLLTPSDVPDMMLDRTSPQYREYLRIGTEVPLFDGFIINTWRDLDGSAVTALRENETMKDLIRNQPVFAVGPLSKEADSRQEDDEVLKWLDRQPAQSVLYVSFGSGGTLSSEQMTELAWGLEMSQQRFIWIIRPPIDGHAGASYFGFKGGEARPDQFLPTGFTDRIQDRGVLIREWGPQGAILKHPATGGFLSHCGWNSTLEGVSNGMPMIAWPLFAEQRMNAAMLEEEHRVAIRAPRGKVVGREEVERMVRRVMVDEEGSVMRGKARGLGLSAKMATKKDGSSYCDLFRFVEHSMKQPFVRGSQECRHSLPKCATIGLSDEEK